VYVTIVLGFLLSSPRYDSGVTTVLVSGSFSSFGWCFTTTWLDDDDDDDDDGFG
jgi:hypothetical protein